MDVNVQIAVEKFSGLVGKSLTFIPKLTTQDVSDGYDLAIKSLTDAKAAYLADPTAAVAVKVEELTDDALEGVVAVLDAEGQTTWAGYVQEADNLLNYVTTHPAITKFILSLGNIFKKKTVAATPAA